MLFTGTHSVTLWYRAYIARESALTQAREGRKKERGREITHTHSVTYTHTVSHTHTLLMH